MGATKAIRLSHSAAWGLPPERPGSPVRRTLGFGGVAPAVIGAALFAGWLREAEGLAGLIVTLLIGAVYFLVWMAVSSRLPHRPGHWTQLVPGAILVAVGAEGLHLFTVLYPRPGRCRSSCWSFNDDRGHPQPQTGNDRTLTPSMTQWAVPPLMHWAAMRRPGARGAALDRAAAECGVVVHVLHMQSSPIWRR